MSDELARALDTAWTTAVTDGGDGLRVTVDGWPRLRWVYASVRESATGSGTVTVEGERQAWRVTYDESGVTGVERVEGSYTVSPPRRSERLATAVKAAGAYALAGAALTAVVGAVRAAPLSVRATVLVGLTGLVALVGGAVAEEAFERTGGEAAARAAHVNALPERLGSAMVAVDDAKSTRDAERPAGTARQLVPVGFRAYLGVLAYVAFGAVGLLGLGVARTLLAGVLLVAALAVLGSASGLERRDAGPVRDALETVVESAEGDAADVDLRTFGDADEVVFDGAAFALPETGLVAVHRSYVAELRPDELRALLAHEYAHLRHHRPLALSAVGSVVPVVPGAVLLATGWTPSWPLLGAALFGYHVATTAAIALVMRRWESTADAVAADVESPTALALALNRIVDRHVVDGGRESLLGASPTRVFASHPFPSRRVRRLLDRRPDDHQRS